MNSDSEQNDRGQEPRRDGNRRSYGRRDDDPQPNSGRNDQPRFSRGDAARRDDDRPRFNRDQSNRDERPRFTRDDRDRRDNDRPRNDNRRTDGGFGERRAGFDRNTDRPRFSRDNDRRPDSANDRRPRVDNDRTSDRPRFNRDNRDGLDRPRDAGSRSTGAPDRGSPDRGSRPNDDRFRRNDRDQQNDTSRFDDNRPRRFDRDDRGAGPRSAGTPDRGPRDSDRRDNDRPRSGQTDRPRFGRDTDRRSEDRPRFNRNAGTPDRGPQDSDQRDRRDTDRPRSSRPTNADKPGFKRVGGFSREADERNNGDRFNRDERPRFDRRDDSRSAGPRGADDRRSFGDRSDRRDDSRNTDEPRSFGDRNPRFSAEQRKESGDRRTGRYDKAPDYDRERNGPRPYRPNDRADRFTNARGRSGDRDQRPNAVSRSRPAETGDSELTRLNRYIANSGVCSRREADELIARGDISVNGKVVTEMGYKVKPGDTVKYGTKVLNPEKFAYVLLNKPKDYLTTTDDPQERKTVMELVADAGNFRLYPVGRLDRNTTGLLLLTNDGELADKLTHPSYNIRKIYQVELDKPITAEHFEALQQGIELEDGPIKPDALSIVTPDAHVVGIEIHSGRNRIVRRMFEHFGYEVTKLDRTTYAGLTKKELPRGKWRFLEPKEVVKLKYLN